MAGVRPESDWLAITVECPSCKFPEAEHKEREVSWVMYVPSWMGDEEYETAVRCESVFHCPACGEWEGTPAEY